MAHHVRGGQAADGDVLHPVQHPHGVLQAGYLIVGQIDLGHVAGDDDFRAKAKAGQEHFHLLPGGVLGFVQNDEAVVQGAAAHIGQRRNLNGAALLIFLEGLRPQHIVQRVIQRPQVGVYLVLQVAGQEAQPFPRFHRRAGEDNAVHRALPEGGYGGGDRQIGLAGTGGADADGDGVLHDGLHVVLLTHGFGLDGLSLGGDADNVLRHLRHLGVVSLVDQGNEIPYPLLVNGFALGGQGQQPFQRAHGLIRHFLVPGDPEVCPPVHHPDVQGFLNSFDIFVKRAKHRDQVLHPLGVDDSFNHFSHLYLQSVLCEPGRSFPRRRMSLPAGTYPPTA